jgi:hypothetical protein
VADGAQERQAGDIQRRRSCAEGRGFPTPVAAGGGRAVSGLPTIAIRIVQAKTKHH